MSYIFIIDKPENLKIQKDTLEIYQMNLQFLEIIN